MRYYAYVPTERDTVREAACPRCGRVNFVAGVAVMGRPQEQVGILGSSVCEHFTGVEHDMRGAIKSVIFESKGES